MCLFDIRHPEVSYAELGPLPDVEDEFYEVKTFHASKKIEFFSLPIWNRRNFQQTNSPESPNPFSNMIER